MHIVVLARYVYGCLIYLIGCKIKKRCMYYVQFFRNIGGSFNHSNHSEINSNNHNSIMHYCNHCTQRKGASVLILSKSQAQPQSDETSRCEHRNATRQIRIPYWTIGPSRIYHQLFFSCSKKPHSAQPTRLDNHRPLRLRAGEVPRARSNGHS